MYIDVRSIFIALPILIINPAAAIANTTLDSFTNGSSVIWTTYTTTTIVPGVKGFLWILDAGQWREVYAGPALTLAPWCEASLGLGIERDASTVAPRFAGSAWFGNGSLSWITVIEYGSLGGAWYLSTLTQKINGISFGVRAKRFVGEGKARFPYPTKNTI